MKTKQVAKHTPGPWSFITKRNFGGVPYYHFANAETNVGTFDGRLVDARLIAAAPEVYDKLQMLLNALDAEGYELCVQARREGHAAIAKAEGRE